MIYLAMPYTHPDEAVREVRAELAAMAAAYLMSRGYTVYAPIVHGPAIEPYLPRELVNDQGWWMKHCLAVLRRCERVSVLTLPGWKESKGVAMEIAAAKAVGMPVDYLAPADLGLRGNLAGAA